MVEIKIFSAHQDFGTGLFCKVTLLIGLGLLSSYLFFKLGSQFLSGNETGLFQIIYDVARSSVLDSILAFSIVSLGIGFILYFFHCQFAKLSQIADEIESENDK